MDEGNTFGLFHSIYSLQMISCTHTLMPLLLMHFSFILSGFLGSSVTTIQRREEFPWQHLVHVDWTLSSDNLLHTWNQRAVGLQIPESFLLYNFLLLATVLLPKDAFYVVSVKSAFSSADNDSAPFCALSLIFPLVVE